jgi:Putative zinc-finger
VLDAFADGALSAEESARVVMHLADCPGDAAYVDAVMETSELLAAAYAAPLYEPLPERLRATIFSAARPPAKSGGWRPRALTWRRVFGAAVAASVGLAVGLAALPIWRSANSPASVETASVDPFLTAALTMRPSGAVATLPGLAREAPASAASDVRLTLIGTFFDRDGRPCREYETLDAPGGLRTQGVACYADATGWTTEVVVTNRIAAPQDHGDGYVPAEGGVSAALDDALDRLGVGMPIGPDKEAELIARSWRR